MAIPYGLLPSSAVFVPFIGCEISVCSLHLRSDSKIVSALNAPACPPSPARTRAKLGGPPPRTDELRKPEAQLRRRTRCHGRRTKWTPFSVCQCSSDSFCERPAARPPLPLRFVVPGRDVLFCGESNGLLFRPGRPRVDELGPTASRSQGPELARPLPLRRRAPNSARLLIGCTDVDNRKHSPQNVGVLTGGTGTSFSR